MRHVACIALVLLAPLAALADTVTVFTDADAYVRSDAADHSFGDAGYIDVYRTAGAEGAFYIGFPTAGAIPSGSIVTSVKLWLYNEWVYAGGTAGSAVVDAFAVKDNASWNESTITWGNQPGASGRAIATSMFAAASESGLGWVSWDVTSAWTGAARFDSVFEDIGADLAEGQGDRSCSFLSRESGAQYAPYLEITYQGPTPELPTDALLGLSMIPLGLAWLRRRGKR